MFDIMKNNDKMERIAEEQRATEQQIHQTSIYQSLRPEDGGDFRAEQDNKADLLRWQQNLDPELFDLVMTLKGYHRQGDDYVRVVKSGICKDEFIYNVVVPLVKPFFSRIIANTNIKEDRINNMMQKVATQLANSMTENYYDNGLDQEQMSDRLIQIESYIYVSLRRAWDGWNKKQDSNQYKIVESRSNISRGDGERRGLGIFNT